MLIVHYGFVTTIFKWTSVQFFSPTLKKKFAAIKSCEEHKYGYWNLYYRVA